VDNRKSAGVLQIAPTRPCLEVFAEFRNPIGIVTKNYLVTFVRQKLDGAAPWETAVREGRLARLRPVRPWT
jgi:hypothetical protein